MSEVITMRHQETRATARRWALAACMAAVLLVTLALTFSDRVPWRLQLLLWRLDGPAWLTPNTVMKVGHFLTWAAIAALAASIARRPRTALLASATVAIASLVAEVLQSRLTDERLTNPADAALNLAGVCVGWAAVRATILIREGGPAPARHARE